MPRSNRRTGPRSRHAWMDVCCCRRTRATPWRGLGFNELYDTQYPAAVAQCTSAEDVQICLDAARGHGVPIAARSGGHSYLGYSVPNDGLVMDLRPMAQVRVLDDGTAQVGAGARLIEVYAALAEAGAPRRPPGPARRWASAASPWAAVGRAGLQVRPDLRPPGRGRGGHRRFLRAHRTRSAPSPTCTGRSAAEAAATSGW
ncbi:FAD-binding oxidoreductase [Yinghuangia aomiensis]